MQKEPLFKTSQGNEKFANSSEYNSKKWLRECESKTLGFACSKIVLETSWQKCSMLGLLCCHWQYTNRLQGTSNDVLHDFSKWVCLFYCKNQTCKKSFIIFLI